MRSRNVEPVTAANGERMIEMRVKLWTDEIATKKGDVLPKHAWDYGVVVITPNGTHGIKAAKPRPFNSLLELSAAIEKEIIAAGLTLHQGVGTRRYAQGEVK